MENLRSNRCMRIAPYVRANRLAPAYPALEIRQGGRRRDAHAEIP